MLESARAMRHGLAWKWVVALLLAAGSMGRAQAASLQVAPTQLQLGARQNAEALWVSNSGTAPVQVQVRVYEWTQHAGQDALSATSAVMASPPMQTLAAGQQQLIRIVRTDAAPPATQQAYRVIVDELPPPVGEREGMQFVLRYSIPVFVQPQQGARQQPLLQARQVTLADGRPGLEVHNSGTGHAQLADLAVGTIERPQIIHAGLLGYVLPGQTMRWPLDLPAARLAGATFTAKINGQSAQSPLPAAPASR